VLPDLTGAAQLCASWQSSCWYTALMSLAMTLIRANTLAFGLIGKDGPHRIIKICFGNMNLVFGSKVALLGFWEYRSAGAGAKKVNIFGLKSGRKRSQSVSFDICLTFYLLLI
jgi:hypothetical protein